MLDIFAVLAFVLIATLCLNAEATFQTLSQIPILHGLLSAPPTSSAITGRRIGHMEQKLQLFIKRSRIAWSLIAVTSFMESILNYLGVRRCTNRLHTPSTPLTNSFMTGYTENLRSQSGMTMKHVHSQIFADAARVASFTGQMMSHALPTGVSRPGWV
jgi:hypothetical protein